MLKFNLNNKVAIVTGASSGIGKAIAIGLAEAGADIVCVARRNCADTISEIEKLGREAIYVSADLSELKSIDGIVNAALHKFGKIDILVNNAGTIRREEALDFSVKDWDDVMNLNLRTLFFLSQRVAKEFVKQKCKGKIINIASMLSYQGGIRVVSYTSSKSGVLGITKALANEWAKMGINVNAIAPGYVITDNTEALRKDEKRYKEILDRIPAGRWADPEDMKGTAVFLASDASDYIHGCTIPVDGGWLAR